MLVERGSPNHCINAGGDVRVRGRPEPTRLWRAGIAHPLAQSSLTVIVEGEDICVATSGTSERGLHVIDPTTGLPATALASVTVVGPDLGTTDAYATAALAMGLSAPAWLEELGGHEAYVVDRGGNAWWTQGFADYAPALATVPRPC
jgi:thiamine biosynthesis lipoprotein